MSEYLKFLKAEEGKEVIDLGNGFMAYSFNGTELFLSHVWINEESRGMSALVQFKKEFNRLCEELKPEVVTGIVFLKQANKEIFLKKLNLFNRVGLHPDNISGDAVILIKKLGEE